MARKRKIPTTFTAENYGKLSSEPPVIPASTDDCPVPECPDIFGLGDAAIDMLERFSLSTGHGAGKAITRDILMMYQIRLFKWIFGHVDPVHGTRLMREIGIEISRKNAKTKFAAMIALLWALSPKGGLKKMTILLVGETVPIAKTLFESVRDLIMTNDELMGISRLREHISQIDITLPSGCLVSIFVRSGADAAQSLDVSLCILDEVWMTGGAGNSAEKGQRLVAGIRTGQGAQPAPLRIFLSTPPASISSFRPGTVYHDWHKRGTQLINREIESNNEMFIRFSAPDELSWDSREAAEAANPGMATGLVKWSEMQEEIRRIKETGSDIQKQSYEALRLSRTAQFMAGYSGWLSHPELDAAGAQEITLDELVDSAEYLAIGVDLGGRRDWSSVAICALNESGEVRFKHQSWVSRFGFNEEGSRAGWERFVSRGELILTDQDSVGFAPVVDYIIELCRNTGCKYVGLDPALASIAAADLETIESIEQVSYIRQGVLTFTPLIEKVEQASAQGKLFIGDDQALRYAFENCFIEERGQGRMIVKDSRAVDKIDPVIACCNALAVCLANRLDGVRHAQTASMDWSISF